ncbi:hypothetical protein H4R33_001965 [Dimargaris cristalligena]|nr:hypothetical protein H4R33_001965 [Dimargaris cristalligena]
MKLFALSLVGTLLAARNTEAYSDLDPITVCCHDSAYRLMNGRSELRYHPSISTVSKYQAGVQAKVGRMTHGGDDTGTPGLLARLQSATDLPEWKNGKENIGEQYDNAKEMVKAWFESPPHHEAMMTDAEMVCGSGNTGGKPYYWSNIFLVEKDDGDLKGAYYPDCSSVYTEYGLKVQSKGASAPASATGLDRMVAQPVNTTSTSTPVVAGTTTPAPVASASSTPAAVATSTTAAAPVAETTTPVAPAGSTTPAAPASSTPVAATSTPAPANTDVATPPAATTTPTDTVTPPAATTTPPKGQCKKSTRQCKKRCKCKKSKTAAPFQ